MRAVYRVVRVAVLGAATALGALCILLWLASLAFRVTPLSVSSGSMEPALPTGSLLLTRPVPAAEISPGDIITTERATGSGLITHRVMSSVRVPGAEGLYEVRLRGDANQSDDPLPYRITEAGAYLTHIPGLGYVAAALQSRFGVLALIMFAGALAVFLWAPAGPPRRAPAHAAGGEGAS